MQLLGSTLKFNEELMTCSWVFPAYEATSCQLEKAKGSPLSGQIRNMCPSGDKCSLLDTEPGGHPCAGLLPHYPPLWVPFAAQECTPMETALVSLTFSGNMTLLGQLGSRSAELAQLQQFRELHAPAQPQTQPMEFNVLLLGSFPHVPWV